MRKVVFGLLTLLIVAACGSTKEVVEEETAGVMIKKDYHEEGYTWVRVTKEHSDDGCGYLLQNKDAEELQLFMPIEWKGGREVDGEEFWIKYTISRIKQDACFNAQPIVITDFKL